MKWSLAVSYRLLRPRPVLLLIDGSVLFLAFYSAVGLRFNFDWAVIAQSVGDLPLRGLVFALSGLLGFLSMGLYRSRQRPTRAEVFLRTFLGLGVGGVLGILLFYLWPAVTFGRGALALAMGIGILLVTMARLSVLTFLDFNQIKRRVLVVGAGEAAGKIFRLRRRADRRRFEIVAYVTNNADEKASAEKLGMQPVVTQAESLNLKHVEQIVVAMDDRRGLLPLDFLLEKKKSGVAVTDVIDFLECETEKLDLDILLPSWLLYEKSSQTDLVYGTFKRFFDLGFSVALLVLAAPIMCLTALAIRLESGPLGGIFYRQSRVGLHGLVFEILKFRSMSVDAEVLSGPRFTSADDIRITRVGRVIRRFRVDELPQLLNVLRGDMSVVGPRPERPPFVEVLSAQIPLYFYRHCVRPGLTGWAQLNFPYGASIADAREKLTYDLYYIKNASVFNDLMILFQTLEVVILARGTSMGGQNPDTRRSTEREPK